jgi:hypothetical protein
MQNKSLTRHTSFDDLKHAEGRLDTKDRDLAPAPILVLRD